MYLLFAVLSAITAALVAVFGKIGLAGVDTVLATTIRGIIMALVLVFASIGLGKFGAMDSINTRAWWMIGLSGLAGAFSWLFYFLALRIGPATRVAAIDRLSIAFVIILAAIFLGEALTWKIAIGGALMVAGALLIVF